MKDCIKIVFASMLVPVLMTGCRNLQDESVNAPSSYVQLAQVAEILSMIPVDRCQLDEVHRAVASSTVNGYDEEYTMKNLFTNPGSGVGDSETKAPDEYAEPLRDLIEDYVYSSLFTKSSSGRIEPEAFLDALMESDIQIYWPFSEEWDGKTMPVVTFDPEDGSDVNIGYRIEMDDDGFRHVEEIIVDEEMAAEVPVWVINRNSDAGYTTLEILRRNDPQWGEGGGNIIVHPGKPAQTKADKSYKMLVLRDFCANRNFDSWFAGASEFFVKIGYLEDFTAMTEAEMRLYDPMVTDFMIVVKRNQVGIPQNFNAVLMTGWHEGADMNENRCAFMITEDDGGTQTEWSTRAKVFVEGKSYGFEISIPLNSRDDVVWRGNLDYVWFDKLDGKPASFGDVNLTFEVMEL
ncbi:MAG: hypothetical protein J6R30_01645 [Bacteroidales bacterium]|nr:hypothetical protein [Bacteroidales bacterium]